MSDIDIIKESEDYDEIEVVDESLKEIDQIEKGKKTGRLTTKRHLKIRRAIEDHLDEKRFRQEVDYLNDIEFDDK